MNRRGFLRAALGATVGVVVVAPALVEALSTRSIFLPPRGGWFGKANAGIPSFLTNYIDPQMLDVLAQPLDARQMYFLARKPEGETDAALRARMLALPKTSFFITETTYHG